MYKDKNKQREAVKNAVRRHRERKKLKEILQSQDMQEIKDCIKDANSEITKMMLTGFAGDLTINEMQKEFPDITPDQLLRVITYIQTRSKKTENVTETLKDVSDWIYKHLDLKLIDIAGGTAC